MVIAGKRKMRPRTMLRWSKVKGRPAEAQGKRAGMQGMQIAHGSVRVARRIQVESIVLS